MVEPPNKKQKIEEQFGEDSTGSEEEDDDDEYTEEENVSETFSQRAQSALREPERACASCAPSASCTPCTRVAAKELPKLTSKEPCLIAVYNYKGGVGKTSTCTELGYALSTADTLRLDNKPRKPCRVLLVDADPQCNLSSDLMKPDGVPHLGCGLPEPPGGAAVAAPAAVANISVPSLKLFKLHAQDPRAAPSKFPSFEPNLYTLLQPIYDGDQQKMLNKLNADEKLLAKVGESDNLLILPGSNELIKLELQLASMGSQSRGLQTTFTRGPYDLLFRLASLYSCEYVIIDLGPSSGALSRTFVTSSDFILAVATPDGLTSSSVYGLIKSVLPDWYNSFIPLFCKGKPRLLPLVISKVDARTPPTKKGKDKQAVEKKKKVKKGAKKEAKKDYYQEVLAGYDTKSVMITQSKWIELNKEIMKSLDPNIPLYTCNGDRVLPIIRNLHGLVDMGQLVGKPMQSLTRADLNGLPDPRGLIEAAIVCYQSLARVIVAAKEDRIRRNEQDRGWRS
eukprot:TRINITY_DN10171_c0_g2_i2.p1 TRINITY_DN10171_c0_g2~~TRINITY_DN10171_c0_g2_i2.p1  ORF type:complete len:509 (-),score=107.40 TRINITY_DN10171_c0_g2_i2:97-1623(-)